MTRNLPRLLHVVYLSVILAFLLPSAVRTAPLPAAKPENCAHAFHLLLAGRLPRDEMAVEIDARPVRLLIHGNGVAIWNNEKQFRLNYEDNSPRV